MFRFTKSYMEHEIIRGIKASGVKRIRLHDIRHPNVKPKTKNFLTFHLWIHKYIAPGTSAPILEYLKNWKSTFGNIFPSVMVKHGGSKGCVRTKWPCQDSGLIIWSSSLAGKRILAIQEDISLYICGASLHICILHGQDAKWKAL